MICKKQRPMKVGHYYKEKTIGIVPGKGYIVYKVLARKRDKEDKRIYHYLVKPYRGQKGLCHYEGLDGYIAANCRFKRTIAKCKTGEQHCFTRGLNYSHMIEEVSKLKGLLEVGV